MTPEPSVQTTIDWAFADESTDSLHGKSLTLLPGELLDLNSRRALGGALLSDHEIAVRYREGNFRIVTEQARYQIAQIPDLVESDDWDLNPEFQRRHRWNNLKRSRLIESIIMNVPIPPIFLYEADYNKFEVMDGLQRLTAIAEFYANRYQLEELEFWPDLNGLTFAELPEIVQRGIGRRYLSAVVLLHETGKSTEEASLLKQLVFERINSGGVDLTPQESRNALLQGPMNGLCLGLARTPSFCRLWGIPTDDSRNYSDHPYYRSMYDVELVLRFFAYRQRLVGGASRRRNLKGYLDAYLRAANGYPPQLLSQLEQLFVNTSDLVEEVLGQPAFWLRRHRRGQWQWVEEPAVVAYEPVMLAFSQRLDKAGQLIAKSADIRASWARFYETNGSFIDGRKVNTRDLVGRNELYLGFLDSFLGE